MRFYLYYSLFINYTHFISLTSSPQAKQLALKQHIVSLVTRYANSSLCWDVVNEAVADSGPNLFKDNVWYPDVPNYVDYSFLIARQTSPNLKVSFFQVNICSNYISYFTMITILGVRQAILQLKVITFSI